MIETIDNRTGDLLRFDFDGFADRLNDMGFNFALCDDDGQLVYLKLSDKLICEPDMLYDMLRSAKRVIDHEGQVVIVKGRFIVAGLGLEDSSQSWNCHGIAMIDIGPDIANDLVLHIAREMLLQAATTYNTEVRTDEQIEMISSELSDVYEELVLLHKLSTNMKLTESDCNYLQMACDSLTEIVKVEGIAVLLEKNLDGHRDISLAAGAGLIDIDSRMSMVLYDRLERELKRGKEALLDSEIDSPFKYRWEHNVRNIIAVPLFGKDKSNQEDFGTNHSHRMIGLMVAVNRLGRADFNSVDAKLFNSVANGCAVFIENGNLFDDLKELFIGSLKALTNSIDAKDTYTRGHSERVAFISKWIAELVDETDDLGQEEIHKIYLAGLLHDIGKMGIDESVLRKRSKLTKEEYDLIKEHPSIGSGILGGIKQMKDVVPGILAHHERVDGTGYPNGLAGDKIPLIARIISLADSFDAMTTKRTYRDAMTIEEAMAEIKKGLGTQYDARIGKMFLESDIQHLGQILQSGLKDDYNGEEPSDYGRIAVGTLIQ